MEREILHVTIQETDCNEEIYVETVSDCVNVIFSDDSGHTAILLNRKDIQHLFSAIRLCLDTETASVLLDLDVTVNHKDADNYEVETEIFQCPECSGVFGLDVSWLLQSTEAITCPLCSAPVRTAEGDWE